MKYQFKEFYDTLDRLQEKYPSDADVKHVCDEFRNLMYVRKVIVLALLANSGSLTLLANPFKVHWSYLDRIKFACATEDDEKHKEVVFVSDDDGYFDEENLDITMDKMKNRRD